MQHSAGLVIITLPEEKRKEAANDVDKLSSQGQKVLRKDLRTATGRLEWMAGMLPQLRPFAQMFWAALTSTGAGPQHVWLKQILLAFFWFRAFLAEGSGLITRRVRADPPNTKPVIAFDASVYGGGRGALGGARMHACQWYHARGGNTVGIFCNGVDACCQSAHGCHRPGVR